MGRGAKQQKTIVSRARAIGLVRSHACPNWAHTSASVSQGTMEIDVNPTRSRRTRAATIIHVRTEARAPFIHTPQSTPRSAHALRYVQVTNGPIMAIVARTSILSIDVAKYVIMQMVSNLMARVIVKKRGRVNNAMS